MYIKVHKSQINKCSQMELASVTRRKTEYCHLHSPMPLQDLYQADHPPHC